MRYIVRHRFFGRSSVLQAGLVFPTFSTRGDVKTVQRVGAFMLEALPLIPGDDGRRKFNLDAKIRVDLNPSEIGLMLSRNGETVSKSLSLEEHGLTNEFKLNFSEIRFDQKHDVEVNLEVSDLEVIKCLMQYSVPIITGWSIPPELMPDEEDAYSNRSDFPNRDRDRDDHFFSSN